MLIDSQYLCSDESVRTQPVCDTQTRSVGWSGEARKRSALERGGVGQGCRDQQKRQRGGLCSFPTEGPRNSWWERPRFETAGTGLGEAGVALRPSSAGSGFDGKRVEGGAWPGRRLYRAHAFLLLWC